eukprot:12997772-Ditylum_brightwellii.AAC.1
MTKWASNHLAFCLRHLPEFLQSTEVRQRIYAMELMLCDGHKKLGCTCLKLKGGHAVGDPHKKLVWRRRERSGSPTFGFRGEGRRP